MTPAQRRSLEHVAGTAAARRAEALVRLGSDVDCTTLTELVRRHGRVTLNFHPDRLLAGGRTVARSLAGDGVYRGQFETGISNGGRSAVRGGDRDRWEQALFGGAYQADGLAPGERPRYGALNLANHSDGGSPRFGSCHVRLRPEVIERCTFTVGDSHLGPAHVGTIDAFEWVLAGLVERARGTGFTVGLAGTDPLELIAGLAGQPVGATIGASPGRSLDDYVEAQVHGGVELARDAEAIVLDPSFRGRAEAGLLSGLADRCGIAIEWHCGFALAADEFDGEFRGPHVPPLAAAVAQRFRPTTGRLDARMIGRAAASAVRSPGRWREFGDFEEMLQYIKHLWHHLVHFGQASQI